LKEKRFVFKEICGQREKFCVDMNLSLRDTGKRKGLCVKWDYVTNCVTLFSYKI